MGWGVLGHSRLEKCFVVARRCVGVNQLNSLNEKSGGGKRNGFTEAEHASRRCDRCRTRGREKGCARGAQWAEKYRLRDDSGRVHAAS